MTGSDDLLPEGLADRLPREAAQMTEIMRAVLDVMDLHGYDRVRPPMVEFERSMADRMDGTSPRNMFRFVDPASLRTLALRSDMTVQIGRIAATSLADAPRPLRLCYAGEVMRIAADQLDPSRQKLQAGAELIGSDSDAAAAEMVLLAIEALEKAGAQDISIDLTLPDLVDTLAGGSLPLEPDQIEPVRRELDTKDAGGLKAAGGEQYLPLLYATGPFSEAINRLDEIDTGGVLTSRIVGLRKIAARIGDRARITLDPTERHGFEYQSWFGFTLFGAGIGGALGRGGTYCIRGCDEVATGFSLYLDHLVDAITDAQARKTLFLPIGCNPDAAAIFRSQGWRVITALDEADAAAALGCTHVLKDDMPTPL